MEQHECPACGGNHPSGTIHRVIDEERVFEPRYEDDLPLEIDDVTKSVLSCAGEPVCCVDGGVFCCEVCQRELDHGDLVVATWPHPLACNRPIPGGAALAIRGLIPNPASFARSVFSVLTCPECARELEVPRYYVSVHLVDRAFGGPEEGGWWYDYGVVQHWIVVSTLEDAITIALRWVEHDYSNEGRRRDIGSVLSEGVYQVSIGLSRPLDWPRQRPRYE